MNSVLDVLVQPQLLQLHDNLYVAAFSFMKRLTALGLVEAAEQDGLLRRGTRVVESSSGNLGLGLADVCAFRGYDLLIIADTNLDPDHRRRMEERGARVETVQPLQGAGGSQAARLQRVDEELARAKPGEAVLIYQYMREANKTAYGRLAAHLAGQLSQIDCLVGTVGTGGSMCGTTRYLRMLNPAMRAVGVDVHGSVLFGQADAPRHIGGLGGSLLPPGLEHQTFDEVHWLSAGAAAAAGTDLHRRTGLFQGPTSGLAWQVADWSSRQHPGEVTVAILPDEAHRYLTTLYDPQWRAARSLDAGDLNAGPVTVHHPNDAPAPIWTRMSWNRRTLADVLHPRRS